MHGRPTSPPGRYVNGTGKNRFCVECRRFQANDAFSGHAEARCFECQQQHKASAKQRTGRPGAYDEMGVAHGASQRVKLPVSHRVMPPANTDFKSAPAQAPPDSPGETAKKYQALLLAAEWIHTPEVRIGHRSAFLLGGHNSGHQCLFVRCVCSDCLAKGPKGAVFSIEELFLHAGHGPSPSPHDLGEIKVVQPQMSQVGCCIDVSTLCPPFLHVFCHCSRCRTCQHWCIDCHRCPSSGGYVQLECTWAARAWLAGVCLYTGMPR